MPTDHHKGVSKDLIEKATKARVEFYNGEGGWENGGFSEETKDEWRDQTRVMLEAVVPGLEEEWEAPLLAEADRLDAEAAESSEIPTIATVKRIQAETIRKALAASKENR